MRDSIEPLFPRYLFLRADPAQHELARVRSTRGICGLVRFGAELARVPVAVIEALAARSDADGLVRLDPPSMRPGDRVRIDTGRAEQYRGPGATSRLVLLSDARAPRVPK